MILYNGKVSHYTIVGVLRFHRWLGKNGENILKGGYQKEGIKYKGGMIPLCHYNLLHMIVIFFIWSSPLVHITKWWLSVRDK